MTRVLMALLLFVGGCAARSAAHTPTDGDAAAGVEAAAKQSIRHYRAWMAIEADHTAEAARAGKYNSWPAMFDDLSARNKAAREDSFRPYEKALNAALLGNKPDGTLNVDAPFNAEIAARVMDDAARGFGLEKR